MPSAPKNLYALAEVMSGKHQNILVDEVNDHCLRLAMIHDTVYDWHHHPDSAELFIVLDGELTIEFEAETLKLGRGDFVTVPAGKIHRTLATSRTINLCLEKTQAETIFVKAPTK